MKKPRCASRCSTGSKPSWPTHAPRRARRGWHVCGEYRHKLTEQDYGWLAMMHKMDRGEVVWVDVLLNKDGNAVLPPEWPRP